MHATGKDLWGKRQSGEGSVTAVTANHDGDGSIIGNTLFHGTIHSIEQIVVHRRAPFHVARVGEGLAKTGRSAEVHAQHCVPAICQPLMPGIESPCVASPWTTMHKQHRGLWLGRPACTI